MSTIYKGVSLAEGPAVSTWKIGVGGQTKRTFEGKQTDIVNKALELQYLGYETEITSGPKWTLIATINIDLATNPGGTTEPEPVPQWELIPNYIERSILDSGRPLVAGLPSSVKDSISNKLKNPTDASIPLVPAKPLSISTDATIWDKARKIYAARQIGIESRREYTVTLRRSISVSTAYNANWSLVNNNYVLSTPSVKSNYGVPNVIGNLMPSSGYENQTFVVQGAPVTLQFFYGWLEARPSYQTVGTNRINISQEWTYNKWWVGDFGMYNVIG